MSQMYTWRGKTCALGLSVALSLSCAPFAFADEGETGGDWEQIEKSVVNETKTLADEETDVLVDDVVGEESEPLIIENDELDAADADAVDVLPSEPEETEAALAAKAGSQSEEENASPLSDASVQSDIVESGAIGENGTWSVTSDGVLTISGEGDLSGEALTAFRSAVSKTKFPGGIEVVVAEGITKLGTLQIGADPLNGSGPTAAVNKLTLPKSLVSLSDSSQIRWVKEFAGESPLFKTLGDNTYLFSDETHTTLIGIAGNLTRIEIPDGTVTFKATASIPKTSTVEYMYVPASLKSISINATYYVVSRVECDPGNAVYRVDTDPTSSTYGSLVTIEPNRWGGYDFGVKATIEKYVDPDTNVVYTSDGKQLLSAAGAKGDVAILDGCEYIAASAFSGCTELASVSIPSSVQIIGNYAFSGCTALTSVSLSDGLTSIGDGAFNGCSSLASIDIPDSVTSIGKGAFTGTALGSFTAPGKLWEGTDSTQHTQDPMNPDTLFVSGIPDAIGTPDWKDENGNPMPYAESIKTVNLANYEASYIPAYMFMGLTGLESVTIPSTVRNIMSGAFFGCEKLTDVYVLGTNTSIQGFGTAGSEVSDFDIDLYPAFGHNVWNGQDWEAQALSLNLYGLAYGDNPIISYAAENNSTFIPFVVLETGVDSSEKLFGFPVTGYNNAKIADMVYTGEELTPQITVSFTDKANGGVADRVLEAGVDCRVTYKDEGGNTVSSIVAPGTYTAQIIGNDDRGVIGTQNVEFRVIDPDQEQVVDPGQQGGQQTTDPGQQGGQQTTDPGQQQAPSQQAGYQPGSSMGQVQQSAALPQTGDTVDVMPFAAVATAAGLVAAGAATVHARRKKDTE